MRHDRWLSREPCAPPLHPGTRWSYSTGTAQGLLFGKLHWRENYYAHSTKRQMLACYVKAVPHRQQHVLAQ